MLADRMCCNDKMVSIFRHGINNDDVGPIAKASFEETPEMFLKAARHGELDAMRGVSANIMCGQEGYYGTSAFKLLVDMEKMMVNKPKNEDTNNLNKQDMADKLFKELDNSPDADECSTNNLVIDSLVPTMKAVNMGKTDDYDLEF
tara:strand:- start:197 stop:634 length:438 start_codon:yes stop_codon:yes gene_type:complete